LYFEKFSSQLDLGGMAIPEAPGGDRLNAILECLRAAQSQNSDVRQKAEHYISEAEKQPGFGADLTEVTVRKYIPSDLRQFGALLLKKFVRNHWDAGAIGFEVRHDRKIGVVQEKHSDSEAVWSAFLTRMWIVVTCSLQFGYHFRVLSLSLLCIWQFCSNAACMAVKL
jgi:hypothetical protein